MSHYNFCGANVQCWFDWFSGPTAAAWLQAVGTILAIVAAIWLNNKQSRAADKLARRQHRESLLLLEKQHKQTLDRERRAYHRQVADRIIPIAGLIEQWESILSHTITFCDDANEAVFSDMRGIIRGQEAAQLNEAIKRVDVQKIPEICLVQKFIKIKNCSNLMVKHVQYLKSDAPFPHVQGRIGKLKHDRRIVVDALNEYRERRDFHINAAELTDDEEVVFSVLSEVISSKE